MIITFINQYLNYHLKNDYDLILFIDTVEHWDKEETKELFKKLNGKKLISTPKKYSNVSRRILW